MTSNGLAIYFLARKCFKMKFKYAIACLIAFETSAPLLLNFGYGAIPDLLGWTICVFFLGFYLNNIIDDHIFKPADTLIPGFLFGLILLTHPFPAIFAVLSIFILHLVYLIHGYYRRIPIKTHLRFFILVFIIGAVISSYYWIPFLLNRNYVSPIYNSLAGTWPGGIFYIVIICVFSLLVSWIAWRKLARNIKFEILILWVLLALALGFGMTRFMPFGLGSLLHGFRYATVMLPFFCILLMVYSLEFIADEVKIHKFYIFALILCLLFVTSVMPLFGKYGTTIKTNLFSYVRNYEQPAYSQLVEAAKGSRLIVPIGRGKLSEGDSPVAFSWNYGVETVNGPYSQGDPKFFNLSVYMEWEENWFDYTFTRENLMQESAAKYLFIRIAQKPYNNMQNLNLTVNNNYGQLWALNEPVLNAANVTPILLDVNNSTQVMEYFNILMPQGYQMIFVNTSQVNQEIKQKFAYVMVDDETKAAKYTGKTVFILQNSEQNSITTDIRNSNIIRIDVPYVKYSDDFFYQGDKGDSDAWDKFNSHNSHGLTQDAMNSLNQIGINMSPYLQKLNYAPVDYKADEQNITTNGQPGFTLIKDSYYPYWNSSNGELVTTVQGLMLVYSKDNTIQLSCKMPLVNIIAGILTLVSLITALILLVFWSVKRKTLLSK